MPFYLMDKIFAVFAVFSFIEVSISLDFIGIFWLFVFLVISCKHEHGIAYFGIHIMSAHVNDQKQIFVAAR